MKKIFKWAGIVLLVLFAGAQFIRPSMENPASDESLFYVNHLAVPSDIAAIITRSCLDCHSHKTTWPWYSQIAPASWLVADDVKQGRRHLNFSLWGKYAPSRQLIALTDIADEVSGGDMPLPQYLLLHPGAALDSAARKKLAAWAEFQKELINP